ncbi:hypothetical protein EYF80_023897 [Liparis tanakae]|uniref:Uncharacterized protein n=1 Tax=Liparis tanakae TaxID=230148 RepID=A0A4Z2HJE6_9TELE|nr:hypothetical protein EYF80_023897 [Liparis tanakae]
MGLSCSDVSLASGRLYLLGWENSMVDAGRRAVERQLEGRVLVVEGGEAAGPRRRDRLTVPQEPISFEDLPQVGCQAAAVVDHGAELLHLHTGGTSSVTQTEPGVEDGWVSGAGVKLQTFRDALHQNEPDQEEVGEDVSLGSEQDSLWGGWRLLLGAGWGEETLGVRTM